MQHVLMTCSSASDSGASVWPAASSDRRASMASAWDILQPRNLTANEATALETLAGGSPKGDLPTRNRRISGGATAEMRVRLRPEASAAVPQLRDPLATGGPSYASIGTSCCGVLGTA